MNLVTEVQILLLKSCLATTKEQREDSVRKWEKSVDMNELDFSSMRLIPYFFHCNQLDGISTIHDKRIKIIYKYWWLRNQHISDQLKTVHAAFTEAGIKSIVIKGASIKTHYEKEELRPMADFDLLVERVNLHKALQIAKKFGFVPDAIAQLYLDRGKNLFLDFDHAICCDHDKNDTQLDLHWKIGASCSTQFTAKLWEHVEDYPTLSGAKKPGVAYEVFMLIIHAVDAGCKDNLNWIIDVDVINRKANQSFWNEARAIAVMEKKQDLFDYGCAYLKEMGVYALDPGIVKVPKTLASSVLENRSQSSFGERFNNRLQFVLNAVNRKFPHQNGLVKSYHLIRNIRYAFLSRSISRKKD